MNLSVIIKTLKSNFKKREKQVGWQHGKQEP